MPAANAVQPGYFYRWPCTSSALSSPRLVREEFIHHRVSELLFVLRPKWPKIKYTAIQYKVFHVKMHKLPLNTDKIKFHIRISETCKILWFTWSAALWLCRLLPNPAHSMFSITEQVFLQELSLETYLCWFSGKLSIIIGLPGYF